MNKNLTITTLLGLTAIILGAFTTHSLREVLSIEEMNSLETGIRYQIYHVLVLLFVNTYADFSDRFKNRVSVLFFTGIVFFSGSIYSIYIFGVSAKSIWYVTPFGGLLLILGWLTMMIFFLKKVINKKK
tara:strand:- start:41516 stop:41902 length:387 start_codon:yes stop_codon:yes gene_type:complete